MGIKLDSASKKNIAKTKMLDDLFEKGIRQGGYLSGRDLVAFASKKILEKPKSGRTYLIKTRSGRRRHVASNADTSPPEFPANLSGALRRSLSFRVKGSSELIFGAGDTKSNTGQASQYARILEEGGQAGRGRKAKIKPRRYLRQTIDANQRNITKHIENEVIKLIK